MQNLECDGIIKKNYSPIIKNGAAKLMPINETPKYIANPKAAAVAITADTLPSKPNHGFDRTVSPIIHVMTL